MHHLVADWQVVADLSFADLLLLIKNGEGQYVVAEQCRPSTMVTLRADDIVGKIVPEDMTAELDAAMESEGVYRSPVMRDFGKVNVLSLIHI